MSLFKSASLLGADAAVLLSSRVLAADVPFTTSAFSPTGGSTSRTTPDRWADWKNVKDFGAKGDGITDDTPAIQAAINWTSADTRGTIYFPAGTYKITGEVNLPIGSGNVSLCLVGDGDASVLTGSVNGFIINRFNPNFQSGAFTQIITIEKLKVANTNTGSNTGAIQLGATQFTAVRDCTVSGVLALVYNENSLGPTEPAFPNASSFPFQVINCRIVPISGSIISGSCGIATGNMGAIVNCDITGYDRGIAVVLGGVQVLGGRIGECNYGVFVGGDQFGNNYAAGVSFRGVRLINNNIAGISIRGNVTAMGVVIEGNGGQYGIYCTGGGGTTASIFSGCKVSGSYSIAAIIIDDAPAVAGGDGLKLNTFIGCSASNSGAGVAWQMPFNAPSARFINCNNPAPLVAFTTLPVTTGDNYHPVEGDEYLISDSSLATSGNFAAVASGGGANNAKVRRSGSTWIIA